MQGFNNEALEQLPWHDAVLLQVVLDRSKPGVEDRLLLYIQWPNQSRSQLVFDDCYGMKANLNFGIVADETILDFTIRGDGEALDQIKAKWKKIGVDLSGLFEYHIETNSTNSHLHVFCKRVHLVSQQGGKS